VDQDAHRAYAATQTATNSAAGPATAGSLGIERRGIQHVSADERWGTPSALFWMWTGAIWNVEYVVYGTLLVAIFGLSFAQAVPVIIIGSIGSYLLTGLASLQGPQAGTTAFTISRASFGPGGNRLPSLFNWITQVGYETEGIALVALAGLALAAKAHVAGSTGLKIGLLIGAVLIQALLPFVGHTAMLRVLKWLAFPFVALFVIMAIITASKVNLHVTPHGAGWGGLMVALALVMSAGGLGWTENANDYSRYLPRNTSKRGIILAVALGGAIPSILLEVLGAAVATAVPVTSAYTVASVTGLVSVFPGWFVIPYLIIAIFQLFAINSVDLYSSGVTLQSLGIHLKRYHCVMIDTVVSGGFAAYVIFSQHFSQLLSDFLLFIIVWVAPWCAIYLVDYFLRRGRYDTQALQDEKGGMYFRNGGWNWQALVALGIGMIAAALWLNAYSPYVSPLSSRVGGSDFSILMGLMFGGVSYYLLARKSVPAEADKTPEAPQ
jgi:NCS1 family nucleobase:cation symporter-1